MPVVLVKNIGDARRKLAKVIREYETDKIKTEKYRALIYGYSKFIESIYKEMEQIELQELKQKVEGML